MSTHTAPRHAAIPTGDQRLIDALAEFGHTHRRGTPKHRKPVHVTAAVGWRVWAELHLRVCIDGAACPHGDGGTFGHGTRRAHLAGGAA